MSTFYHLLCSFWSYLETLPRAVTGLEEATNFLDPWKCHHLTRMHTRVAEFRSGSFSEWALHFSPKTIAPSAWGQDQTRPLHLCLGFHCLLVALGARERKEKGREKWKKKGGNIKWKGSQTKLYAVSPFNFVFHKSVRTDESFTCYNYTVCLHVYFDTTTIKLFISKEDIWGGRGAHLLKRSE